MSETLNGEDIPCMASGFRLQWEEAQGCHVILYPEGMVKLNPAAGEILSLCDGGRTVADIVTELTAKFPEADNLHTDVFNFLNTANDKQWIQCNPA